MALPVPASWSTTASLLEDLESRDSCTVVRTLFNREIANQRPRRSRWGKVSPESTYDTLLLRQLAGCRTMRTEINPENNNTSKKSRKKVKGVTSEINTEKHRRRTGNPSVLVPLAVVSREKSVTSVNNPQTRTTARQIIWVNDMLLVRFDKYYTCFQCENSGLREKYHIPASREWKAWDVWNISFDHPLPDVNKKIGTLLFTLSASQHTLDIYYLDSGERYHAEINLDTSTKYDEVLPSEQTGKLIIPCDIKANLPKDLIYDCILIDIIDPTRRVRFQIKKDAPPGQEGKPKDISCSGDLLILSYKRHVRIWRLSSVLNSTDSLTCLDDTTEAGIAVSHVINTLDEGIFFEKTETNGDFVSGITIYPPLPYIITDGSVYDLHKRLLAVPGSKELHDLQNTTTLPEEGDGDVRFLEESTTTSSVVFRSKNILCIATVASCQMENGIQIRSSELLQETYMKFGEIVVPALNSDSLTPLSTGIRKSTRERKPVNYSDIANGKDCNVRIQYKMAQEFGALVVMEVSCQPPAPNFQFHFFDNQSWRKMFTIVPTGDKIQKIEIAPEDLTTYDFMVNLTDILLTRKDTSGRKNLPKFYVVPLMNEFVDFAVIHFGRVKQRRALYHITF